MSILTDQISGYLRACELEKKLSPDTVKAYRIDLAQFAAFAEDSPVDKLLLSRYAAHLNQCFAPRSVKRKLASVRAFYAMMNIITHCCPSSLLPQLSPDYGPDQLTKFLEEIKAKVNYHYWLFGHYHDNKALDMRYILLWEQIVQIQ